jgi:transposase
MDAPFGSWGTQTFIAGLTTDAMIAPWVIKGAMDGAAFAAYVEKVLVPELTPGTVVILDNLATHKNAEAEKAMRKAGCWFLFLPPYSPDLNPIEMAFSKLKAHLRRIGARTFTDMFNAIAEICDLYSPEECWNFCGCRPWCKKFLTVSACDRVRTSVRPQCATCPEAAGRDGNQRIGSKSTSRAFKLVFQHWFSQSGSVRSLCPFKSWSSHTSLYRR